MNRNKWIVYAALLAAVASTGIAYAGDKDEDESRPINGDYQVVIASSCVRTAYQPAPASGFDPNTRQLVLEGQMLTALGSGLMRFDEDGTVQLLDGSQTEVSLDQTAVGRTPVAPPAQFTCSGKYTRQGHKVALTLSCDIKVPDPGVKVTLGPQDFVGYIGRGRQSISMVNIAGGIQTISVSVGGMFVQQRQRICTQQVSGIK